MPLVGFEPTIPAFERAKTVHALDRAATVIGEMGSVEGLSHKYYAEREWAKCDLETLKAIF
jgi:hypothetical protein